MLFRKASKLLEKWAKVLELGFWDGYLLNKLSNAGFVCTGQDISERNIELTQKQWWENGIQYMLGKTDNKIIADNASADLVIASEVLEHMTDDELYTITDEMYRIIPEWWYCILTFPARENLSVNSCSCPNCWEVFHKWGHKQSWNDTKIKETFRKFSKITISEFVSRTDRKDIKWFILWYMKAIWSYILWINKSYLVILEK
jgi:2-polyprenyl-3-methyl-5-hydroxy-6-metoxy-1,4-benzoquinol methylase